MQSLQNFHLLSTLNTVLCLFVAFVCGSIIGLERQIRQRTAGLRTNTLVAVGAAVFVDLAMRLSGADGATRVIAYVVSGVGFLGAGAIMKEGANVTGLNTAATLWGSAAVGALCGSDYIVQAGLVTVFVLMANTLLRHLVLYLNTRPTTTDSTESNFHMYVICERAALGEVFAKLQQQLDSSGYAARSIEKHALGAADTEIEVLLLTTIAKAEQLNAITATMEQTAGVKGSFWHTSPLNS